MITFCVYTDGILSPINPRNGNSWKIFEDYVSYHNKNAALIANNEIPRQQK